MVKKNIPPVAIQNHSTRKRSLAKGITWEIISFLITTIAVYLIYGNFYFSVQFSLALSIIKIFFYFMHERAWKRVVWGRC